MFFGNMGLDVLLAEPLGIFGIGLASSLSSLASLLVILPAYIRKDATIHFETGTAGWEMARCMFVLGFLFFPINAVINTLLYGYKAQGRMTLVNIMSFVEVAATGVFAVLTAPRFGADAVWLANTWSDILVLPLSWFRFSSGGKNRA